MLSRSVRLDLTERLRAAQTPVPDDVALLGELLIDYNGALAEVADGLRSIGLEPTTRIKTTDTIVEKLKRQPEVTLVTMQDLAGARVVRDMTLDEQDDVVQMVSELWPDAKRIDRRSLPSSGYRAVHLVPKVGKCRVEVQLRTFHQDMWAQIMEVCGDVWGREVRYGGQPKTPDAICGEGSGRRTRREWVSGWIGLAVVLHELACLENDEARARTRGDTRRRDELRRQIAARASELVPLVNDFASMLDERGDGGTSSVES